MKNWIAIVGLIVFALPLQGCDSAESSATSDDNGVVYCTGEDKADDPYCVEPDATESPPGDDVWIDEDDVYVEPSVGCDNLWQIAGDNWYNTHTGADASITLTDLTKTCRMEIEGTWLNKPVEGTDLPLESYLEGDILRMSLQEEDGTQRLTLEYYINGKYDSSETLVR